MSFRGRSRAFTIVEIMVVIAIIGIIIAIAAPTWMRQREISRGKACQENLSKIWQCGEQYALEFRLSNGSSLNYPDCIMHPGGSSTGYLKRTPACPADGEYSFARVGDDPVCSIGSIGSPSFAHVLP